MARHITIGLALAVALVGSAAAQTVLFVDANADQEPHDGSDWCHAYLELFEALAAAEPNTVIRVADGTYLADTSGLDDPREATFQLINGVTIAGGYAGCGADDPDERDVALYETTLSGDIGIPDQIGDNCYHVVTGSTVDATAVLNGVTVTAGNADGPYGPDHDKGGGMYSLGGSPTVIDCTFMGNFAYNGAGMYNDYLSDSTLTDCTFSGNSAYHKGGGMCNWGPSSPTVTNCTFSGNSAARGAGMLNDYSSPMVMNCTFSGNQAGWGGGMYNWYISEPTLIQCTFSGNTASVGGGICTAQDNSDYSNTTLINCTFSGNSASYRGGGMYAEVGNHTLVNCLFIGNSAEDGGGIYNSISALWSDARLTNCTISGNSATRYGGGMHNVSYAYAGLANCIVWDNAAPAGEEIHGAAIVTYSCIRGGWLGEGNIDADPLFADPENQDYHLLTGSPCINAGSNYAPDLPYEDQEGNLRIQHCRVDMGAYESPHPGTFEDCNNNGGDDDCDVYNGVSDDCNENHIPDECLDLEGDCNANGFPDDCDLADGTSGDCNANGVPDECDVDPSDPDGDGHVWPDCNANGVPDPCDIDPSDPDGNGHVSADCNENHVPDECDVDPNDPDGDGQISADCNENGVPDECLGLEGDCNGNGVPDQCDVDPSDPDGDGQVSEDCNQNLIPDECLDLEGDCNANNVPDECDIDPNDPDGDGWVSDDCQPNGLPDECDIVEGRSFDAVSEPLSPIGAGSPQSFTLVRPLAALGDVTLWFEAVADLGAMDEWIDVDINGVPIGRVYGSFGGWWDCPSTPRRARLIVDKDSYNAVVGEADAVITMVASDQVDPDQCDPPSYIIVSVEYVAERDCNANGVPDECDVAHGASEDHNGNGVPDECECVTDLDADGDTDQSDLGILLADWGCAGDSCPGDIDGDGDTDHADLGILLSDWGCGT